MCSIFNMYLVYVIFTAHLVVLFPKDVREIRTIICENSTSILACHGNATLRIVSAIFGRTSSSMCADNDTSLCKSNHALTLIQKTCDGKSKCFIPATKTFFGDSCKAVNSYVDAKYKCVDVNSTNNFIFTSNKDITQFGHSSHLVIAVGILATLFGVFAVVLSVVGLRIWRRWRERNGYTRSIDEDDLDFSLYAEDRSTVQYDRISAGFTPIFTGSRTQARMNTLFD